MVKLPKKIKKIVGGLLALGIFLFLATFGNSDLFGYVEKLKADVFGAIPIITSTYPDSGAVGDLIYVEGQDLGETVEENILKFGDTKATIASVGLESGGSVRIVATVPDLPAGEYSIKLETPMGIAFNADTSEIFTILDETTEKVVPREKDVAKSKIDELILENEENLKPAAGSETENILAEAPDELAENESAEETADFELFAENSPLGVQLRWEYPAAVDFAIFYGSRSEEYLHRLSGKSSPTFLSNLASGQQYFFKVVAFDSAGNEIARSAETATIATAVTAATGGSEMSAEFIHASATPERLSAEGPAEMLAIAILAALGISGILFRRKIGARK